MSKLGERMPALATREERLSLATHASTEVVTEDGRINIGSLREQIEKQIQHLDINEERLVREGRTSAAREIAQAFTNSVAIKLNRDQRVPVYQARIGFERSYFKVGSELVPTGSMTIRDFENLLDRQALRIDNAQTDQAIIQDLFDRARPGLEAGQNLVQQYEAGVLELFAADGEGELEAAEE